MPRKEPQAIYIFVSDTLKKALKRAVKRHEDHTSMTSYIKAAIREKIDREANRK